MYTKTQLQDVLFRVQVEAHSAWSNVHNPHRTTAANACLSVDRARLCLDGNDLTHAYGQLCFAIGMLHDEDKVKRADLWWLGAGQKVEETSAIC